MRNPKDDPSLEIEHLRALLNQHTERYEQGAPSIPDAQYDSLYQRLKYLEAQFSEPGATEGLKNSPTQTVGSAVPKDKGLTHTKPMLSLSNAMDEDDLRRFNAQVQDLTGAKEYHASPKWDGLAVSLIYKRGSLVRALTRGDGTTGEDVTENVKMIASVPHCIRELEDLTVRGEVIMPHPVFEALNRSRAQAGEKLFISPRNAAAGSLKLKDPETSKKRYLFFKPYDVFGHDVEPLGTLSTKLDFLHGLGFILCGRAEIVVGLKGMVKYQAKIVQTRKDLQEDVDGVVFVVNDLITHEVMGHTAKAPKYAIAYKFPAEEAITTVRSIDVQVGRTGVLTPVARLEPVFVGGATVSNVTLNNFEEIRRLSVREGSRVLIKRCGDVIPGIVRVIAGGNGLWAPHQEPKSCPSCGAEAKRDSGFTLVRCTANPENCPAQFRAGVKHFCGKKGLDIDCLGDKIIDQLVDTGYVVAYFEIFQLTEAQFSSLERVGPKLASKIIENIQVAKKTTFPRFLISLGIPMVGEGVSQLLASHFQTWGALLQATPSSLEGIPGIGPQVRGSVLRFLERDACGQGLLDAGVCWPEPREIVSDENCPVSGKTFVLTGTLSVPRSKMKAEIEGLGGKVVSSVSKKVDFLLCGDSPGGKLTKAEALGIVVLNEAEFLNMRGEPK